MCFEAELEKFSVPDADKVSVMFLYKLCGLKVIILSSSSRSFICLEVAPLAPRNIIERDEVAETGEKTRLSSGLTSTSFLYKLIPTSLLTVTNCLAASLRPPAVTDSPRLPGGAVGILFLAFASSSK